MINKPYLINVLNNQLQSDKIFIFLSYRILIIKLFFLINRV